MMGMWPSPAGGSASARAQHGADSPQPSALKPTLIDSNFVPMPVSLAFGIHTRAIIYLTQSFGASILFLARRAHVRE